MTLDGASTIVSRTYALTLALSVTMHLLSSMVAAQTYTVIHDFTGGGDGEAPYTGLTIDAAGNLYGTTVAGGNNGARGDLQAQARRLGLATHSHLYLYRRG